jgi:hypothetical protein
VSPTQLVIYHWAYWRGNSGSFYSGSLYIGGRYISGHIGGEIAGRYISSGHIGGEIAGRYISGHIGGEIAGCYISSGHIGGEIAGRYISGYYISGRYSGSLYSAIAGRYKLIYRGIMAGIIEGRYLGGAIAGRYIMCPDDNSWQLGRHKAGQLRFGFVAVLEGHIVYPPLRVNRG